jgi:hypothetical protein
MKVIFHYFCRQTVAVAQLVRASDCGSEGRRFDPGQSPLSSRKFTFRDFFYYFVLGFCCAFTTHPNRLLIGHFATTRHDFYRYF